jgi:MOSC domain-containing protein YiiM
MQGIIVQVNTSRGGLPKRAVPGGFISEVGLEGDAHAHPGIHGGPRKAILLIAAEIVDDLAARGYPLFYGALGENLTTLGIPVRQLRIGDRLAAGGALLEITQPRGPCSGLHVYGESLKNQIYDARVEALDPDSPRWGMSGFYARVLEPGYVRANDSVRLLSPSSTPAGRLQE